MLRHRQIVGTLVLGLLLAPAPSQATRVFRTIDRTLAPYFHGSLSRNCDLLASVGYNVNGLYALSWAPYAAPSTCAAEGNGTFTWLAFIDPLTAQPKPWDQGGVPVNTFDGLGWTAIVYGGGGVNAPVYEDCGGPGIATVTCDGTTIRAETVGSSCTQVPGVSQYFFSTDVNEVPVDVKTQTVNANRSVSAGATLVEADYPDAGTMSLRPLYPYVPGEGWNYAGQFQESGTANPAGGLAPPVMGGAFPLEAKRDAPAMVAGARHATQLRPDAANAAGTLAGPISDGTSSGNPSVDEHGMPVWEMDWIQGGGGLGTPTPWYTLDRNRMVWDADWYNLGLYSLWARSHDVGPVFWTNQIQANDPNYSPLLVWRAPADSLYLSLSGFIGVGINLSTGTGSADVAIVKRDHLTGAYTLLADSTFTNLQQLVIQQLSVPTALFRVDRDDEILVSTKVIEVTGSNWVTLYDDPLNINLLGYVGVDQTPAPAAGSRLQVLHNPTRGQIEMSVTLPVPGAVSVFLYDISGRQIGSVVRDLPMSGGVHQLHGSIPLASQGGLRTAMLFAKLFVDGKPTTTGARLILVR